MALVNLQSLFGKNKRGYDENGKPECTVIVTLLKHIWSDGVQKLDALTMERFKK